MTVEWCTRKLMSVALLVPDITEGRTSLETSVSPFFCFPQLLTGHLTIRFSQPCTIVRILQLCKWSGHLHTPLGPGMLALVCLSETDRVIASVPTAPLLAWLLLR